ncbi:MAG: hypothetical protein KGS60_16540 [Verrucomicrobia bacterium]|nr:hypothetical protein [Verrucomicrobiota bacterium]
MPWSRVEIKEFYAQSLGIRPPRSVFEVIILEASKTVEVRLECDEGTLWIDPDTGARATVHGWW